MENDVVGNGDTDYIKQTLFVLSNSKMIGKDLCPLIEATLIFQSEQKEVNLPLRIANFPYLAVGKIKIHKTKHPPSIKVRFITSNQENSAIEKIIQPRFSSVISIYISNNCYTKPDLEEYKMLYKLFLDENKSSIKIPSKESLKACRSFILKKNSFNFFAPFFLGASYYLTDSVSIQYVQIYSQLRINGKIRSIDELVNFSNALYSFLIKKETKMKFLNENRPNISSNYHDANDNNNNNNIKNDDHDDNLSMDQLLFINLFEGTISDVLSDLEKAELHGPHSSILFLACIYTNVFNKKKIVLPKKWHFMPIELFKQKNQNDQKHTGRFHPDNFCFFEASMLNKPLSAITCYSPLFHDDMKYLTKTVSKLGCESRTNKALILACLKFQQLNKLFGRNHNDSGLKKLDFVYLYPLPNQDIVEKYLEIVRFFNHNFLKEDTPIEFVTEKYFDQIFWKIMYHYIPNLENADDQNIDSRDISYYQQFYELNLKNLFSL